MKCYFFGTFNPVHLGHIQVAQSIKKQFGFDDIIFVPAYSPPHKNTLNFKDRVNMLKLCNLTVDTIESFLEPPTYTYKTIEKIGKCTFIIGYDAFSEIESWKKPEYLKKMLHFLVVPRKTSHDVKKFEVLKNKGYTFEIVDFNPVNISSNIIRQKSLKGLSLQGLTTQEVEDYINEYRLYEKLA